MKDVVAKHSFNGRINTDIDNNSIQSNEIRDAINTDLFELGKIGRRTNLKGTKLLNQVFNDSTDYNSLNILNTTSVFAKYDYNGDGTFEKEHPSIIIFSYDNNNKSRITLYDIIDNRTSVIFPNNADSSDLEFPPLGTISAVYDKEQSENKVYWDDFKNQLRSIKLKYSTSATYNNPTSADLEVRKKAPLSIPTLSSVESGGLLLGGSYQFAFRFYNTNKCTQSGWSLFTNQIPIIDGDCELANIEQQLGASVGQTTNKKIILSIDFTNTISSFYNAIQLAVVKNTDGSNLPQTIAYITDANEDWYNTPTNIVYDGISINEITVPIEQIVVEDANIAYAKDLSIKENRLFRANIKYHDREFDNGTIDYASAETIEKELDEVPYKCPSSSNQNVGYFREEVYAFAPAYQDEYGNWQLGEVFDFNKVGKFKRTSTTIAVTSATAISDPNPDVVRTRLAVGTNSLTVGDYIEINGNTTQVVKINSTSSIDVYGNVGSFFPATAYLLFGQKGNQGNTWAWKFPKRSDNQFTLVNENNKPTNLGLRIEDITNHPSWAKSIAIVRQKRQKNILYQTPIINTIGALGIPTQGIGAIMEQDGDIDDSKADYRGDLDTLTNKVFGFGNAKNFYKYEQIINRSALIPLPEGSPNWAVYYPYMVNHSLTEDEEGSEVPNYITIVPPEYIFNNNGESFYNHDFSGGEKINIVDALALKRKQLVDDEIVRANSYHALDKSQFYYSRTGKSLRLFSETFFRDLSDFNNLDAIDVISDIPYSLSAPSTLLSNSPFDTKWLKDIRIFGGAEELSVQQGNANAIPSGTKSFFNTIENQRLILLNIDDKILDFTATMTANAALGTALFPDLDAQPTYKLIENSDSINDSPMGFLRDTSPLNNDNINLDLKLNNKDYYACEDGEVGAGIYIANIEKGLSDNRYSKNSSEWYFTGAFKNLTESDIENNTPVSFDVFGGDCFVTKNTVKVNNNTLRISDVYDNIAGEATDYDGLGLTGNAHFEFEKNAKLGSFENNVEFLEYYTESEVNTAYHEEEQEYPSYQEEDIGNYSNPYFYRYNFGYSAQNLLKKFVATLNDCVDNGENYPSSYVWSNERIYQSESNEFSYIDGFSTFPVLNRKDLDEKFGAITKIVDFGDEGLHFIQERRLRYDPINRNIIQDADGILTTVLGDSVVGSGGIYLPFDNGSSHIRTVKYHNGICFFVDVRNRQIITFGSKGANFKPISDIGFTKFIKEYLLGETSYPEHQLSGFIDHTSDNNEYLVVNELSGDLPSTIVWSDKLQGWKTKIQSTDQIKNAITSGQFFFWINNKNIYEAYANDKRGYFFGNYNNTSIKFTTNKLSEFVKVFDSMRWDMFGGFKKNIDSIIVTIEGDSQIPEQISFNMLEQRGSRPSPITTSNFQYFTNWIRNNKSKGKLFGRTATIEIIIDNSEENNREVGFNEVEIYSTRSYPNR